MTSFIGKFASANFEDSTHHDRPPSARSGFTQGTMTKTQFTGGQTVFTTNNSVNMNDT